MGLAGCLFYDANILFSLLEGWLQEAVTGNTTHHSFFVNAERMHSEAKKSHLPCFASKQSYTILENRVSKVNEFTANTLRSFVQFVRQKKTEAGKLVTFDVVEDVFLIEAFMLEQFRPLGKSQNWEKESLQIIERLIFDAVERASKKGKEKTIETQLVIDEVLSSLVDLSKISDGRQNCLVRLHSEVRQADVFGTPELFKTIKERVLVGDDEDVGQLSVALQHQKTQNIWTVFVSTDYVHVISVAAEIMSEFKLQCSPPLYSIPYLKRILTQNGPVPDPKQYIT